jgi:protein-S-isoprenylcysteine O-methyltransferase Ste14
MTALIASTLVLFISRYTIQLWMDMKQVRSPLLMVKRKIPSTELIAFLWGLCLLVPFLLWITGNRFGHYSAFGFLFVCAGNIVGIVAVITLGRSYSRNICIFPDHQLVTEGIYSVVRHPIRLGMILEVIGFAFFLPVALTLFMPMVFTVLLIERSKYEDAMLRVYFKRMAVQYQKNVPSFNVMEGLARLLVKRTR